MFKEEKNKVSANEVKVFQIALNKDSKITDLKQKVVELAGEDIHEDRLMVTNFDIRSRIIATRFKND
jgi:hypothetical protein